MTHLINRLRFELNCTDENQAFNFRQNFGITFQKQITDITDKICSAYVGEEEWLRIEKLEIDLGRFSPASFDENFVTIFKNKFEKALTQKLSGISLSERKISLNISKLELLKYFLKTGTLPWWASEQDIDINEIMLELITNDPDAIKRFFYHHQFKKNLWTRVDFQLNTEAKTQLILLIDELKIAKELFLKWMQQSNALQKNETNEEPNDPETIIENVVLKNASQIFQNIHNENILLEIFEKNVTEIKQGLIQTIYETVTTKENISDIIDVQLQMAQSEDEEIATDKYVIKHAGIILLSPFIKSFFTNLQLLNGKEWKNKDAQYKAVHLLKFLSTGEQKTFEYNLILEKIMCGLNIDEPIPLEILLEEHETNEAVSLLESVIEHWKAIKNTSVNGLRESFLKRDGLLTKKENDWLLQVERKTLDVLVDSIPWGFSTIAFSWNENLIFVEW